MWKLEREKDNRRIYKNSVTNSECTQTMCYTDKEGNSWWSFDDLTSIPHVRKFAADKIIKLYTAGLTIIDLRQFATSFKTMLRAKDDGEKYEKAYNEVLKFEEMFEAAADPIRQQSALVPVFFTMNEEEIDSFVGGFQLKKMSLLEADMTMHGFFLKRQMYAIEAYTNFLKRIFQTVSLTNAYEQTTPLQ